MWLLGFVIDVFLGQPTSEFISLGYESETSTVSFASAADRHVRAQLLRFPTIGRSIWNAYYSIMPREIQYFRKGTSHDGKEAFTQIFDGNEWISAESKSGWGSTLEETVEVRGRLPRLVRDLSVSTFLDAPCGDYNWMRCVQFPKAMRYIGADIVPDLVDKLDMTYADKMHMFLKLDVVADPLPAADLWLCRHTLFHLPLIDVTKVLRRFKESQIKYLLTTNHNFCRRNVDVNPGGYRYINLRKAPFNLPKPILQFDDFHLSRPPPNVLALWSREQIPDL